MKTYSLRKARHILHQGVAHHRRKRQLLSQSDLIHFERLLTTLDSAIHQRNQAEINKQAEELAHFNLTYFPRRWFHHLKEIFFAIIFALVVAVIVRKMWFEPYEIPTGSMRPTFREEDKLVVSKVDFGINVPLMPAHFYFNPSLVERAGTFVFTVENLPVFDADTVYFYLFPGKKQFVKRCMGKPGDTLYFYGGKIYGIDKDGIPIHELLENPYLERLEYIPFISFDGRVSNAPAPKEGASRALLLAQMNQPLIRLSMGSQRRITGELIGQAKEVGSYGDVWGLKNFAMARLLTPTQAKQFHGLSEAQAAQGLLFLELRHDPSIAAPAPRLSTDEYGRIRPTLISLTSLLPLQQSHLDRLMENMYTARFVVHNGRAFRWQESPQATPLSLDPLFPGVPDGRYEFYYGKAYEVGFGALLKELPPSHPLYSHSVENVRKLFNLGMEFLSLYEPSSADQPHLPHRYAYFRNGSLYTLGAPLMGPDDPLLEQFVQQELSHPTPYRPFVDHGPPVNSAGVWDAAFIRKYGLHLPEEQYLALGDNHANSGDSREFGFVPQANINGAPWAIFWPPGPRWGYPAQIPYALFVLPRMIVWGAFALFCILSFLFYRRRNKYPIFKPL